MASCVFGNEIKPVTGIQTYNLREDNYQVIHSLFSQSSS